MWRKKPGGVLYSYWSLSKGLFDKPDRRVLQASRKAIENGDSSNLRDSQISQVMECGVIESRRTSWITVVTGWNKDDHSLTLQVPDQTGHLLGLVETKGTNVSTGPGAFLNGASVRNVEQWDLTNGYGIDRGFIIFEIGADSLVARYEGRAIAKAGAATNISGQFTFVRGTGAWAAISGEGSYEGSANAQGFEFQWRARIR